MTVIEIISGQPHLWMARADLQVLLMDGGDAHFQVRA